MPITALILAAGEGSRLKSYCQEKGLPKHLLPLPNRETIIGRLAKSLVKDCDEIVVAIKYEEHKPLFEQELTKYINNFTVFVKTPNNQEYSEIKEASKFITNNLVVQTNGDLIFADGVIEDFLNRNKNKNYFYRGREGNNKNTAGFFDIFNSRISILPKSDLEKFNYDNKIYVIRNLLKSLILNRVEKVPTLFNVDTLEDYKKALEWLDGGGK